MSMTREFMDALTRLERDGDVEPIASLFADECDVGNSVSPNVFVGRNGAREFWSIYRSWFGEIESRFHNVISSDGRGALEWSSSGTNAKGLPISYEGVSVLEHDGNRILRFRAYFNPDALGRIRADAATTDDVHSWLNQ